MCVHGVCVCSLLCVCTLDGLWVTILGCMSRHFHFPAEFSSNPNQTHLSMLINVFRVIRKSQVAEFDKGWR